MSIRLLVHRALNLLQAEESFVLSWLGIVRVHHLPTFISVEPANVCQLRCPQCPVGMANGQEGEKASRREGERMMGVEDFKRILSQVAPYVHTMQFYFQGEPLLNTALPQMIALAHEIGIYTIVSTNGQALTPVVAKQLVQAGLSRIIVSIDGLSEESYHAYRVGGSLQKALDALTYLRQAKQEEGASMHIEMQALRLRSNENEWEQMKRDYRSLGADSLSLKSAQFYHFEQGNELMPSHTRYARYAQNNDGTYRLKHPHTHVCHRLWTGAVVTVNGELLPCCMDKAGAYSYGNIFASSLEACYHSDAANRFRSRVLKGRFDLPICRNC